jgi:hypothetical protein
MISGFAGSGAKQLQMGEKKDYILELLELSQEDFGGLAGTIMQLGENQTKLESSLFT